METMPTNHEDAAELGRKARAVVVDRLVTMHHDNVSLTSGFAEWPVTAATYSFDLPCMYNLSITSKCMATAVRRDPEWNRVRLFVDEEYPLPMFRTVSTDEASDDYFRGLTCGNWGGSSRAFGTGPQTYLDFKKYEDDEGEAQSETPWNTVSIRKGVATSTW